MANNASRSGAGVPPRLWGYLVEFETPEALVAAARRMREAGMTRWDAHSPFPVHGLDEAMGLPRTRLPWVVFVGGLVGGCCGLLLQWWMNAVDYPYLVSGKPFFSLPASIPVMFELTILFSAFGAFFGMLAANGLPLPYHAVMTSPRFHRATADRFFISIEANDPRLDGADAKQLIESLAGGRAEEIWDE